MVSRAVLAPGSTAGCGDTVVHCCGCSCSLHPGYCRDTEPRWVSAEHRGLGAVTVSSASSCSCHPPPGFG